MAKKSKSDQSKEVYSRVHHLERDGGTVRNLDSTSLPSNARPLEAFVPLAAACCHDEWRWDHKKQKGETVRVQEGILENAQRSVGRGRFTAVTSGYRQRREEALRGGKAQDGPCCAPSGCGSGSVAPPLSGAQKFRY